MGKRGRERERERERVSETDRNRQRGIERKRDVGGCKSNHTETFHTRKQ